MKKTIYVDIDGTLLDKALDVLYIASGKNLAWYSTQYVDTLAVNFRLVHLITKLKKRGHKIVLWTNRGTERMAMTKANLGSVWYLFNDHQFHGGKKLGTNVDGYTLDNEAQYVTKGILIDW